MIKKGDYAKERSNSLNRLLLRNERSEQAHIHHAPTLRGNYVYNEWQFKTLLTGNPTENQFHLSCTKLF